MPEESMRRDARAIFDAGLGAADARLAVSRVVLLNGGDRLTIGSWSRSLDDIDRVFVVGAGKAAWPMAAALEDILGPRISDGHVTTKYGHGGPLNILSISEAGHPVPDEAGVDGAKMILHIAGRAGPGDLVLCLISGGGSALMPLPAGNLTLSHKQALTKELLNCGATIHEINSLRKHLSAIKGGRLALAAAPATVISLILSDVIGDDLDVIASGPTVPDRSTFADCDAVLEEYGIRERLPKPLRGYLEAGVRGAVLETPKPGEAVFEKTWNFIVGNAAQSIEAAGEKARELGYTPLVLSSSIEGETREVAKVHAAIAREVLKSGNPVAPPACILSGGETTVTVRGNGTGGRNMEFALAAAIDLDGTEGIVVLSGGTDGTDGPTDAAGAVVDGGTVRRGGEAGKRAREYLGRNDSYNYFCGSGELLMTGPTLTNVMDLRIMLVGSGDGRYRAMPLSHRTG
ncbi:MAG: glycerate kinase [Syntrophales bacterium]|jgi:hydroxypyruvate reductase|nr:glycerate kinase [Syntrophales bacterium]MCK9527270.1 glycerate kinase [Syntrophales bacterium]MDX9921260.1 glycerate kinase [Syntrophales bacterium]